MDKQYLARKEGRSRETCHPIAIGPHIFQEAVCDFGASVNITPKVIYEKILGDPLLYTNMHLQLADQSFYYPKGVLKDIIIQVDNHIFP